MFFKTHQLLRSEPCFTDLKRQSEHSGLRAVLLTLEGRAVDME